MRQLLVFFLLVSAGPAQAMNWEGHDDWMVDMEPALALEQSAPAASAPKQPVPYCPPGEVKQLPDAPDNPYEQIDLLPKNCRADEGLAIPRP